MLKTWLGKKGFEVSSVSNIARARKHIESQTVDLVLSDLRLPDYEGIDLLKWMNDQGLDIPLIIMTGSLPVPLEPLMSTDILVGATRPT